MDLRQLNEDQKVALKQVLSLSFSFRVCADFESK